MRYFLNTENQQVLVLSERKLTVLTELQIHQDNESSDQLPRAIKEALGLKQFRVALGLKSLESMKLQAKKARKQAKRGRRRKEAAETEETMDEAPKGRQGRKPVTCKICGKQGHNRKTCPKVEESGGVPSSDASDAIDKMRFVPINPSQLHTAKDMMRQGCDDMEIADEVKLPIERIESIRSQLGL